MTLRTIKFISAIVAAGLSASSLASMKGDTVLALGLAQISPYSSIGEITSTDNGVTRLLTGTTASNGNTATVVFSMAYMFSDNIAAKINLGIPPRFSLDANIPALGAGSSKKDAASARVLTPVAQAQYIFLTPEYDYRPYVGLGITYASYTNISASLDPTVQALAGTYQAMSPSWAPVISAGSTYRFNDNWSMLTSLSYIPLKTDITLEGAGNGTTVPAQTSTATLTMNPIDYVIQIGYTF